MLHGQYAANDLAPSAKQLRTFANGKSASMESFLGLRCSSQGVAHDHIREHLPLVLLRHGLLVLLLQQGEQLQMSGLLRPLALAGLPLIHCQRRRR